MAQFYDKFWDGKEGHLGDFVLKWPKLLPFIPREAEMTIVDFGCGTGRILSEIKKLNPGAKLIGLDVSSAAIDEAKKILPEAEFHKIEDGGKILLADGIADFIFSSEVIEHVYDTENAAKEIARIMKPGGKLLLTTPYHGFLKNLAVVLSGKFDFHFNPTGAHVRFFTNKTLFSLFEKYGLKVEKHGYYGRFWPLPHSVYFIAIKK